MKFKDEITKVMLIMLLVMFATCALFSFSSCRKKKVSEKRGGSGIAEELHVFPEKLFREVNEYEPADDKEDADKMASLRSKIRIVKNTETGDLLTENLSTEDSDSSPFEEAIEDDSGDYEDIFVFEGDELTVPFEYEEEPSWTEKKENGITVREDFVINEGVFKDLKGARDVDIAFGETVSIEVLCEQKEGERTDYRVVSKLIADEVKDYLMNQHVSNSFSHISDPDTVLGTNLVLEGTPFYCIPGFIAGKNISRIEIDENDADCDGIYAAVYEKCDVATAKLWMLDLNEAQEDIPVAVFVNADRVLDKDVLSIDDSLIKDCFYVRRENHLGVEITRFAEKKEYRSDYFFLAYPLCDGRYVIDIAGGIILLSRAPEKSVDIYFCNGGGDLGFFDIMISVDGQPVLELSRFNVNSTSVVTEQY